MKIGEFFVALNVDVDKQDAANLNGLIKKIGSLEIKSLAVAGALSLVGSFVGKSVASANQAGQSLYNMGKLTGISTKKIQQWSFFAEKMGVSADSVTSSIKSLSLEAQKIAFGQGGNIAPFQALDISPFQDTFKILDQLRDKLKQLPIETGRLWAGQMNISEDLLILLRSTDEEWGKVNEQFFLTNKQIVGLKNVNKEWLSLKQSIHQVGLSIGVAFEKPTAAFFAKMTKAAKDYRYIVEHPTEKIKNGVADLLINKSFPALLTQSLGGMFFKAMNKDKVPAPTERPNVNVSIRVDGLEGGRETGVIIGEGIKKVISDTAYQTQRDNI